MKALMLEDKNMWREMKVQETEKPSPGPGEVLIRIKAAGLKSCRLQDGYKRQSSLGLSSHSWC